MKIYYVENKKIIEGDTEDYSYRRCILTSKGVMPQFFLEDGFVKYTSPGRFSEIITLEVPPGKKHKDLWREILEEEFEYWANELGNLDFYWDLESAQDRVSQLIEDEKE